MKTFLFIVLAMTLVLGAACMNDIPTDPNMTDVYKDYPVFPEMEQYIADRSAQAERMPPGWIPDGTLMTDEEILVHMAAHIAEDVLPGGMDHPAFCSVYTYFHTCFSGVDIPPPFTYARFLVWFMESNGWDVPDVQDIFPDC